MCFVVLQSCTRQDTLTIFVDPTLATSINQESLTKYFRQNLAEYLDDDEPATVNLKLIFENTASIANSKYMYYSPLDYDTFKSDNRVRPETIMVKMYYAQKEQYKLLFIDEIVKEITSLKSSSKASGIAEIIVPLSKVKHSLRAVVITDLIQDSSILNLRNGVITKESEVMALAKKHALKMKSKYIIPEKLEYTIILDFLIVTKEKEHPLYPFLETYWRIYFKELGITINFETL